MDRKKERRCRKTLRKLKSDAAKCVKLTELFSKGLNSAAAAEDSCAAEVRRKQKIQLAQVIFTLLLTVSSSVFLFRFVFFDCSLHCIKQNYCDSDRWRLDGACPAT